MVRGNPNLAQEPKRDFYRDRVIPNWENIGIWARGGVSNAKIASNLRIGESTFAAHISQNPELKDYLRECREDVEILVENALLKRALGYEHDEITRERVYDEDAGKDKMVITKKVRKTQAPDVGAATYWLERRSPNRWTSKPSPVLDSEMANARIASLAILISHPVPERKMGDEEADK